MSFHRSEVDQRRRRRKQLIAAAALLLTAGLIAGFYLGQRSALAGMGIEPEHYRGMQEAIPRLRAELAESVAQLEVERARNEMDRQALEMVRGEIAAQKEQIADLAEGLMFYKSLMSPGEINQGLSLRPIELVAREDEGHYAFRIVAQQQALKHQLLKGNLEAEVFGVLGEEQVSYPLAALSGDLDGEALALRFRYFQAFEGEMMMPAGFEPARISVVATVRSPRKIEVREDFPWHLKERFTHVGK